MYWNLVYRKIFNLWKPVKELICCLDRMNCKHLYYQKNVCLAQKGIIASVINFYRAVLLRQVVRPSVCP